MAKAWTREELAALELKWGTVSLAVLARKLGRTERAVWQRANRCGLTRGIRQSTLHALGRELGASYDLLLAIVERAGVRPLPDSTLSQRRRSAGHRQVYYDELRVREAFDTWLGSETMSAAAVRLGVHDSWLKRRLVRAGVYVEARRHRYLSKVIEAAVATWKPRWADGDRRNK